MNGIRWVAVLVAGVLIVAGCEGADRGRAWTPVLEGTPPSFLEREVGRALEEVRGARAEMAGAPEAAGAALDDAAARLANLMDVYLPLYRAKVEVTNAYRRHALGQDGATLRAVEAAQEAVMGVNRATGGALEPELDEVVEPLAKARLALDGGSDAGPHLQRAAETLSDLLTRAGLIR